MSPTLVRGAAALAGSAVVVGLSLVAPGAQAATIPTPSGSDPAPARSGAAYLAAQPGANGLIPSYFNGTPSYYPGITVDAATSLAAVGGQDAAVDRMAAGVETSSYSTSSHPSAAKFAAFEYTLGRSSSGLPAAVNDVNTHLDAAGRLMSSGYTSPLDQAYAAKALHDAGASGAASSLAFLLTQQCSAGFFRSDYTTATPDQSCDAAAAGDQAPSIDNTAFTVLQLQDQKTTTAVANSLAKAVAWLALQQAPDGSFASGFTGAANANSTGLAAWALGTSGRADLAAKAASWLRAHQLANAGGCTPFAAKDNGAIVADDLGLANARKGPMSADDNSTAAFATGQALPALLWAPGGTAAGETTLTGPTSFVPAGSTQTVSLSGAPGNTLCITKTGAAPALLVLGPGGTTTLPLTLPATTGAASVSVVDAGGETDAFSVTGLAATKLHLAVKPHHVHPGDKLRVKVTGLAPGEQVTVSFKGKTKHAVANARGHATVKLKATKMGHGKVKAIGAFLDRKGTKGITVRR